MKLKELITQYAAFRKSMGADFESAESLLNTFCRRMGVEIDVREIRAEQVAMFLAGTGPVNRYWRRKYDTLRGLYRYATSRGFVDHVPLPATVPENAGALRTLYLQHRRTAAAHQPYLSRANRIPKASTAYPASRSAAAVWRRLTDRRGRGSHPARRGSGRRRDHDPRHEIPQDAPGTRRAEAESGDGAIRGTTKRGWSFAE